MRRRILLADDSPTIQRLVTQTFADANFEIISVSNGDAAIRKFDEILPSVVLADIYMPGKNGFEVCSYVKSHPSHSSTPVVLLVGAFDAFDEENGKQVGAIASITKPFEPHALVDLVQSVISGSEGLSEGEVVLEQPPRPQPRVEPKPVSNAALPAAAEVSPPVSVPQVETANDNLDLLGLAALFKPDQGASLTVSDDEIERIAARVLRKLSAQVIEDIAWEVVPDITEKIVREELKRIK